MTDNPYQPPPSTSGEASTAAGGETFAGCPSCGQTYATKVGFTFWGGVLGPKLLNHVKCSECGTKYNGKTGLSNLVPIIIYSIVTFGIAMAILFVVSG